jgi:hypothetical protein
MFKNPCTLLAPDAVGGKGKAIRPLRERLAAIAVTGG